MLILLFLLLPVAALGGWIAAKRGGSSRPEAFWENTRHFHQGLADLFNDRSAVDEDAEDLLDSLAGRNVEPGSDRSDADRDTAETHIALGNLFRRRGDVERAILLHRSLTEREALADDVRGDARYELARDYESAGLLDRSQAVFRELIERGERLEDAYASLVELHESEQDWALASGVVSEYLKRRRDAPRAPRDIELPEAITATRLAHYCCELASDADKAGYDAEVDGLLAKALEHEPSHARAHLASARRALAAGEPERALQHFEATESSRPDLVPEFIDERFEAFDALGDEARLAEYLDRVRGQKNAYSVIRRAREAIEARDGQAVAARFFKDQIVRRPSLRALRDWARDQVDSPKTREPEKVAIVVAMLDRVVEDKPAYACAHCGFRGNVLHWRCPSCGHWDTVSTIIGAEGE